MTPILYRVELPVRFSDLDPYGHVNASHYLDYVVSGRWLYALEKFGVTGATFVEKGVGFYMTRAEMTFRRPIIGTQRIVVTSHVREVADTKLFVPFDIRSKDEKTVHSEGLLEFAVVDVKTGKPTSFPEWVRPLFFEEQPS